MGFFETADGTRLHYTDWGAGAPVVFASSWAAGGAMWEYQSAPLELTGRRTAQAIPGSELIVYAGAAHGLFLTHKERLSADLLAFIQRQSVHASNGAHLQQV